MLRKILIVIGVLIVIGIIAGIASGNKKPSTGSSTATTVAPATATASGTGNSGTSSTGVAGAGNSGATTTTTSSSAYPNGEQGDKDFAVQSLQVANDGLGDIGGTVRITNVGTQAYTVEFTITFFATPDLSGSPLGSADGSAQSVAPGQTVTESIVSQNPMFAQTKYYYQFQVNTEY